MGALRCFKCYFILSMQMVIIPGWAQVEAAAVATHVSKLAPVAEPTDTQRDGPVSSSQVKSIRIKSEDKTPENDTLELPSLLPPTETPTRSLLQRKAAGRADPISRVPKKADDGTTRKQQNSGSGAPALVLPSHPLLHSGVALKPQLILPVDPASSSHANAKPKPEPEPKNDAVKATKGSIIDGNRSSISTYKNAGPLTNTFRPINPILRIRRSLLVSIPTTVPSKSSSPPVSLSSPDSSAQDYNTENKGLVSRRQDLSSPIESSDKVLRNSYDIFKLLSLIGSKEGINFFPGNKNHFLEMERDGTSHGTKSISNPFEHNNNNNNNNNNNKNYFSHSKNDLAEELLGPSSLVKQLSHHREPHHRDASSLVLSADEIIFGLPGIMESTAGIGRTGTSENRLFTSISRNPTETELLADDGADEDSDYEDDDDAIDLTYHGNGLTRPKAFTILNNNNHDPMARPVLVAGESNRPLKSLQLIKRPPALVENEPEDSTDYMEENPVSLFHNGIWKRKRSGLNYNLVSNSKSSTFPLDVGMDRMETFPWDRESRLRARARDHLGLFPGEKVGASSPPSLGGSLGPGVLEMDNWLLPSPKRLRRKLGESSSRLFSFRNRDESRDQGRGLLFFKQPFLEARKPLSLAVTFQSPPRSHSPLHPPSLSLSAMDFENRHQQPISDILGQLLRKSQEETDPNLRVLRRLVL